MAKAARPGQVKTRLASAIGPEAAAELYAAMLEDRCDQVERLDGVQPALALFGADEQDPLPRRPRFELVPQPRGGLGAGLATAAEHFLARAMAVVLVDSDSPSLPLAYLERAVELLRLPLDRGGRSMVLGPAEDGGYYLIGLRQHHPELFEDIPWSSNEVVDVTLARARQLGLEPALLPSWWDVDSQADLQRLERSLFDAWWPRRSAEWLRRRKLAALPMVAATDPSELWRAPWARSSSRQVYATRWMTIREDEVVMPSGQPSHYGVVDCGQCVGVLPFVDDDNVLLVRQFRYVADQLTWEMPTGGVDRGADPAKAGARELAEEAHVLAGRLDYLGCYHTSKSVMDETAHLYVASDLQALAEGAAPQADDSELLRAEKLPFDELVRMVQDGRIVDSMTIIATLRVALARRSRDGVRAV